MKTDSRIQTVHIPGQDSLGAPSGRPGKRSGASPPRALAVPPQLAGLNSGRPSRSPVLSGRQLTRAVAVPQDPATQARRGGVAERRTLRDLFAIDDGHDAGPPVELAGLAEIEEEDEEPLETPAESPRAASGGSRTSDGATGNGGSEAASGQRLPTVGKHDEIPLAAYILARQVDGRAIPERDAPRLRSANETVVQTRKHLQWGRGNVRQDNEVTGQESLARSYMAQELALDLAGKEVLGFDDAPQLAGAAIFAKAGTCREHAVVATHIHAAKLNGPDDSVHLATRAHVNHAWSELRSGEGRSGVIVMDPWADGPATYAADARHARVPAGVKSDGHYDMTTGSGAHEKAYLTVEKLANETPPEMIDEFRGLAREQPPGKRSLHDARPGIHKAFGKRVKAKMSAPVTASQASSIGRKSSILQSALRNGLSAVGIGNAAQRPTSADLEKEARQLTMRRLQADRFSGHQGHNTQRPESIPAQSDRGVLSSIRRKMLSSRPGATDARTAPTRKEWSRMQHEAKIHLRGEYDKAEGRFAAAQTGVRNEIKAIGVARSLGWANTVREAVKDAKDIVEAAQNLRRTTRTEQIQKAMPGESVED